MSDLPSDINTFRDWTYVVDNMQTALDLEILSTFLDVVAYQGFDPMETLKQLLAIASSRRVNRDDFFMDMARIVTLVSARGTALGSQKAQQKSTEEGFKEIQDLMTKYSIAVRLSEKTGTGAEVITFSRVAIVFSEVMVAAYDSGMSRPVCTVEGLPRRWCCAQAPSVMSPQDWDALKEKWLEWSVKFSKIINRYKKTDDPNSTVGKTDEELRENNLLYAENARNSDFYTNTWKNKLKLAEALSVSFRRVAREREMKEGKGAKEEKSPTREKTRKGGK